MAILSATAETGGEPGAKPKETIMTADRAILAAAFALVTIGAAHADGLRPIEGRSIDLGGVSGVVYYTAESDGFRVVATFAQDGAGVPMRIEAALAPGQSVMLSTPNAVGTAAEAIEIVRQDNKVSVRKAVVTN